MWRMPRSSSIGPCSRAARSASPPSMARTPTRPTGGRWATASWPVTPLGRDRLRPCRNRRVRTGAQQRREAYRTRGRDLARTVRGRAHPHPARRALRIPAQGQRTRRCARPADGVPDHPSSRRWKGRQTPPSSTLWPSARTAGRRTPTTKRTSSSPIAWRKRKRLRAQGDAPEPYRGRRDGSRAPPPSVRIHRRDKNPGHHGRLPGTLGGQQGSPPG